MWYYEVAGCPQGPVADHHIKSLLQSGSLGPKALIWTKGMPSWAEAASAFYKTEAPTKPQKLRIPPVHPAAPARSFPQAIRVCLQGYARFQGRASRSEFWYFAGFVALMGLLLSPVPILAACALLTLWVPLSAALARRLQDLGRSGWWHTGPLLATVSLLLATAPLAQLNPDLATASLILALLGYSGTLLALALPLSRKASRHKARYNRYF